MRQATGNNDQASETHPPDVDVQMVRFVLALGATALAVLIRAGGL